MPEIRCDNKFFGTSSEDSRGFLEITCPSRFCKVNDKDVVLHVWNLSKPTENGVLKPEKTLKFKKPEVKGFIK